MRSELVLLCSLISCLTGAAGFVVDTVVYEAHGLPAPIQQFVVGNRTFSTLGNPPETSPVVTNSVVHQVSMTVHLTIGDQHIITTLDQQFLCVDKKGQFVWRAAQDMRVMDQVVNFEFGLLVVKNVAVTAELKTVWVITAEPDRILFVTRRGFVVRT